MRMGACRVHPEGEKIQSELNKFVSPACTVRKYASTKVRTFLRSIQHPNRGHQASASI